MIYTEIDICNRALGLLNQKHIDSFTQNIKEAQVCRFLFYKIKAEVLSSNNWNKAIKQLKLYGVLNNEYTPNYSYKYSLPAGCLRVISVNFTKHYLQIGQYFYTNSSDSQVVFLSDLATEDLGIHLSYLIALKLAVEMSFMLNNDPVLQNLLRDTYEIEYKKVANLNSLESNSLLPTMEFFESTWINSRWG